MPYILYTLIKGDVKQSEFKLKINYLNLVLEYRSIYKAIQQYAIVSWLTVTQLNEHNEYQ